jgi:hypothetical protein
MDDNVEYVRSAYLNDRRPHIKSRIGYRTRDKHSLRVITNDKEFIKFTKANILQYKRQATKTTNNPSSSYKFNANSSHVSHMYYHEFDTSCVLMRNKFEKVVALPVGSHHKRSKTCVWVPKFLVTNLRGLNQSRVCDTLVSL